MSRQQPIRIGTRESALALYQAQEVQHLLYSKGLATEIFEIISDRKSVV